MEFIQAFLRQHPGKRVLIHCKGGIGRAATMAVAWYMSEGLSAQQALERLQQRRPIVSRRVLGYSVISALAQHLQSHQTPSRYVSGSALGELPTE